MPKESPKEIVVVLPGVPILLYILYKRTVLKIMVLLNLVTEHVNFDFESCFVITKSFQKYYLSLISKITHENMQ